MTHNLLNTIRYHNRTYYKCIDCGERASNNGGRCKKCRSIYSKANKKTYKYPCINNCGNMATKPGTRCRECYIKDPITTRKVLNPKRIYPCKECGTTIHRQNGLCIKCYNKHVQEHVEKKQAERNRRIVANEIRISKKLKTTENPVCPKSPNKKHFEIISNNIGECKYCNRRKNYGKLLEPYLGQIGM